MKARERGRERIGERGVYWKPLKALLISSVLKFGLTINRRLGIKTTNSLYRLKS